MHSLIKLLHLAAAVIWLGGIGFMLAALRPVAMAQLPPPTRLPFIAAVMRRFFAMVWLCIGVLLLTGGQMLASVGVKAAPLGWHWMLGIGLVMVLVFAHLFFGPFRRLKIAVAAENWPAGRLCIERVAGLAALNLVLGAVAIVAVVLVR